MCFISLQYCRCLNHAPSLQDIVLQHHTFTTFLHQFKQMFHTICDVDVPYQMWCRCSISYVKQVFHNICEVDVPYHMWSHASLLIFMDDEYTFQCFDTPGHTFLNYVDLPCHDMLPTYHVNADLDHPYCLPHRSRVLEHPLLHSDYTHWQSSLAHGYSIIWHD